MDDSPVDWAGWIAGPMCKSSRGAQELVSQRHFGASQRWMGCLQGHRIPERGSHKGSPVLAFPGSGDFLGNHNIYRTTCAERMPFVPSSPCHSQPGHASCAVDAFTDASDRCNLVRAPLHGGWPN